MNAKTHHCRLSLIWDDKRVLAVVHDSNDPEPSPEERANAQLIVKAVNSHHDLLEACKDLLHRVECANMDESDIHPEDKAGIENAKAAIAKAQGTV